VITNGSKNAHSVSVIKPRIKTASPKAVLNHTGGQL
jgi:hypothetical protein